MANEINTGEISFSVLGLSFPPSGDMFNLTLQNTCTSNKMQIDHAF